MNIRETDYEYEFLKDDVVIGKIMYQKTNYGIEITQVWTNPDYRGQGLAGKFIEELVAILKEKKQRCKAGCSYAAYWFETHPENGDVLIENES